ncbi:MAG: altronate dehydratase family protein [Odoribacteraceae bacterium]|nr:altronate dehydratase family protein [Odoribacteraceae bacterium]
MKRLLKIHPDDQVAVALDRFQEGERAEVDGQVVILRARVEPGHKVAVLPVAAGENVIKYGQPIGRATANIAPGEHVHDHNLTTNLSGQLSYEYRPSPRAPPPLLPPPTCLGYARENGQVGVRDELWIIPTVGCVNGQARDIAGRLKSETSASVIAYTHPHGCSQVGEDHQNTRDAILGMTRHPNAGGVLVVGLGCENNQVSALRESLGEYDRSRVRFIIAQEEEDEIARGVELARELLDNMQGHRRVPLPLSLLKVGLKCGGSDGFSGITANPLLGLFSDWLTARGGTAVLAEVPEMFGAETLLMNRAANARVFDKTVRLVNDFKRYFRDAGQPVYENPSPGNKAGGITTLEEKSLGCVQKGGTGRVADVLPYAQPVVKPGLNLLQTPGNDLVSSTALAVSGCHVVIFTTGRGTPFGAFVPTLKVSSTSSLALRKPSWIDFDAGVLLHEDRETVLARFIDHFLRVVNGEQVKHETANHREIAFFKTGVTL